MKIWSSIAVIALAVLSCSREDPVPLPEPVPEPEPGPSLVHHVLEARAGEEDPEVKAVINPEDDTRLLWSVREEVGVFSGSPITPYLFTGTNASASASASFEGDAPAELGSYILVTPYRASSFWNGTAVTTTLPAVQEGYAGGFAPGMAVLAGQSSTMSVTCRHVCSGIRFTVRENDIALVSLRGNHDEGIAGSFSFVFEEDLPKVSSAGTAGEVTLAAPGGGTFEAGKWYYITCLPAEFSQGITLTAVSATRGTGVFRLDKTLRFDRAKFKNKTALDDAMTWTSVTPSVSNTYYGLANTFCLQTGESVDVDVTPKMVLAGWQRSGVAFPGAPAADACEVLWGTATVTASLSQDGSTLTIQAGANAGTALVAIKSGDTILWSFLVWVTASVPAEITLPSGAVMQEPLGGGTQDGNLFFQWGRKDPLKPDAGHIGTRGLSSSITNPQEYIDSSDGIYDWLPESDGTLWGEDKTVWDPCPQGWKAPVWDSFAGLGAYDSRFAGLGYIANNGYYSGLAYWTATSLSDSYSVVFLNTGNYYSYTRNIAAPVRCVKE